MCFPIRDRFICTLFNRYRKQNQVLSKPILVSVLRDFDLDLPKDPDRELKRLFEEYPGGKRAFDVFREIKAIPLVKPVEGKVKDLHNIPDTELQEEFVDARKKLYKYLRETAKPLRGFSNKSISGKVLTEALRKTVKAVNDEDLKGISKTLPDIFEAQNEKTRKSAVENYKEVMAQKWPASKEPETVTELHETCKHDAIVKVKRKCFIVDGSVELKLKQFKKELNEEFEQISKERSECAADNILKLIKAKMQEDAYNTVNGYKEYCREVEEAENEYTCLKNMGPQQYIVWEQRKKSRSEEKRLIQDRSSVRASEEKASKSQKEADKKQQELETQEKSLEKKETYLKWSQRGVLGLQGLDAALGVVETCLDFKDHYQ